MSKDKEAAYIAIMDAMVDAVIFIGHDTMVEHAIKSRQLFDIATKDRPNVHAEGLNIASEANLRYQEKEAGGVN